MEEMKYYIFKRESGDFKDILTDTGIRKYIVTKIRWYDTLIIGLAQKTKDNTFAYIVLKYGDDIVQPEHVFVDRRPVMYKDYYPADIDKLSFKPKQKE